MIEVKVTKKEVMAYEDLRKSGATNMFDVKMVEVLSNLSRTTIFYIMENYDKLIEKYKIER